MRRILAGIALISVIGIALWLCFSDDAVDPGPADAPDAQDEERGPELAPAPLSAEARPEPEEAEPPPASDASPEPEGPSAEEQRRLGWGEKVEPGVIEGVVYDGEVPLTDAEAFVWDAAGGGTPAGIPVGEPPLRRLLVDREGRFRFDGLEGGSYFVGVKVPGEPARLAYGVRQEIGAKENRRVVLVLGSATVTGVVYRDDGRPAPDALVRLSLTPRGASSVTISELRTDADGRFTFPRLLAGGGWLSVAFNGDLDDRASTRTRRYSVGQGEVLELDVGSPKGVARVTGTVRARSGDPLRGPGRLILQRTDDAGYVDAAYDEEGRFEHRVPAGTYDVHVWMTDIGRHPNHVTIEKGLVVGHDDLRQDLTVPGSRIRGRVAGAGRNTRVRWTLGGRIASASVRDGTYVIDGLKPGEYELSVGDATERVTLTAADTEIIRDLRP